MEPTTITENSLRAQILQLKTWLNQRIIGQEPLIDRMLTALLADGHLLVEGAPGLAKTRAVKELAAGIKCAFHRIQFTPDLLPGDLTGTDIFHSETGTFAFQEGPIFHNLVLADEINRAPAKVQSAMLEAMAERQVTIGSKTRALPRLFFVMATQNPIEQEGTYPLPEAQLDRFLMYVKIDYPNHTAEQAILELARNEELAEATTGKSESAPHFPPLTEDQLLAARREIARIHTSEALETYIVNLVLATRNPEAFGINIPIRFGASPRATIALDRTARARAWLLGRDYVTPEDVQAILHDVMRHRILLTFEAEAEGITSDDFILSLQRLVAIP